MKKQSDKPLTPLAQRVMAVMEAKGLKARTWSLLAGADADLVRNILRGKSESPRGENLMALADAAGIDVDYLLFRSDRMDKNAPLPAAPAEPEHRYESNSLPAPHSPKLAHAELARDVPVLGIAEGGPDGTFFFDSDARPIDYVRRPPRLTGVQDAYALYVQGLSMRPWREEGQLVYVVPRIPAQINDYVAVQLRDEEHAKAGLIKRLVKKTPKEVHLEQYNPPKVLVIPSKRVVTIHKILDWSELMGV